MRKFTQTETTTNTISSAKYLINLLIESGIDTIFGYPGAPILPIYNALSETNKIKHILNRHEQGAIHSAEGYARTKNKCGVVLVTSGPGFTNIVTGLANAKLDNTPLLVISGQVENQGQNEFQDIDIVKIAKPCSKKVFELNEAENIEKTIKDAIAEATKVPQGPVVITVKNSVLNKEIENNYEYKSQQEIKVGAPHSYVKEMLKTLQDAKSPLMIIGGGAKSAKQEIVEFAKLSHIPVVNTLMGTGCADEVSLGLIGINGDNELNKKIQNADVIVAVGTRFGSRTTSSKTSFLKNSKIYNINLEPNTSANIKIEKDLIGEANVILQHIIGTIKAQKIVFNVNYRWIESFSTEKYDTNSNKLTTEIALQIIHEYTKKYYPTITTDVGLHQVACAKIFKTTDCSHFLTSGGLGAMGYGLPCAIGAQIANPNSLVINITGDGSFQMNMQELGTVEQYNLPIKIFLMNNSSLGMISETQKAKYNKTYQSDMLNPDFSRLASAYGISSYKVKTKEELEKTLKEIFICKRAILVEIIV